MKREVIWACTIKQVKVQKVKKSPLESWWASEENLNQNIGYEVISILFKGLFRQETEIIYIY